MANRYRKWPVVIEAVQWTGENGDEVKAFTGLNVVPGELGIGTLKAYTLQGFCVLKPGEWLVRDATGRYLPPMKPDDFEATYEPEVSA